MNIILQIKKQKFIEKKTKESLKNIFIKSCLTINIIILFNNKIIYINIIYYQQIYNFSFYIFEYIK